VHCDYTFEYFFRLKLKYFNLINWYNRHWNRNLGMGNNYNEHNSIVITLLSTSLD